MVLSSFTVETLGALGVILWGLYQVYAPKFGLTTRMSEVMNEITEPLEKLATRLDKVENRQDKIIISVQAIAMRNDGLDASTVQSLFDDEQSLDEEELFDDDSGDDE